MPTTSELWIVSTFFIKRLFAKGKLSVTDAAIATEETNRVAFRITIRWLAGMTEDQPEAIIFADLEDASEHQAFADWMMEEIHENFSYSTFDNIDWRFNKGWRNRYPKGEIPAMGKEPVDPKSLIEKVGKQSGFKVPTPTGRAGTRRRGLVRM